MNRGHAVIHEEDVIAGLRTHSLELVEEISLEIRDVAPEIENAVYLLLDCPARIPHEDLLYLLIKEGIDDALWTKLIDLFLWYGVLGIVREEREPVYIYSVNYNFAMLRATLRKAGDNPVYAVNSAFTLGLGTDEREEHQLRLLQ